jgi:hypothetical protein
MEMVAHDTEGQDLQAAEVGVASKQSTKVFLLGVTENESPINHTGDAMVEAAGCVGWCLESSRSHGVSYPAFALLRGFLSGKQPVPSKNAFTDIRSLSLALVLPALARSSPRIRVFFVLMQGTGSVPILRQ